ncbi:MAG: helix-hairpin-helix domain-containing protein [Candidatus Methanomethyliaceae archaeon]|nr:helix-hairpin-helix domain-containing protein [Candidatus Methanomethyliaceae archaeon]
MSGHGTLLSFISQGKESLKILVDHRERPSLTVKELIRLGAELEFRSLSVGDYVISECVAIERKTMEDFANSIIDRRLFEQARALRSTYSKPLIILEGRGPLMREIREEAITGALVSLVMDLGIPVIWVNDAVESAKIIMTIAKREERGDLRSISLKDRRRAKTPDEEKEYIVASLPMVEAATAKRLLSFFGSVEKVFTASERELMEVEGIGPKKAKRIREAVTGAYGIKTSFGATSQEDPKVKKET